MMNANNSNVPENANRAFQRLGPILNTTTSHIIRYKYAHRAYINMKKKPVPHRKAQAMLHPIVFASVCARGEVTRDDEYSTTRAKLSLLSSFPPEARATRRRSRPASRRRRCEENIQNKSERIRLRARVRVCWYW